MRTISVDLILVCSTCGKGIIVNKKTRSKTGYIFYLSPCRCVKESPEKGGETKGQISKIICDLEYIIDNL